MTLVQIEMIPADVFVDPQISIVGFLTNNKTAILSNDNLSITNNVTAILDSSTFDAVIPAASKEDEDTGSDASSESGNEQHEKSFMILMVSNVFFIFASICYLIGAILDLKDLDGYIIMNSLGAFGFVINGGLDFYNNLECFHILLILAGIFGLLSAAMEDENDKLSDDLNFISAHMFLLESLKQLHVRFTTFNETTIKATSYIQWLWVAESCFFAGSMMDVILSYIYLMSGNRKQGLTTSKTLQANRAEVAGAVLWVLSSVLTTFSEANEEVSYLLVAIPSELEIANLAPVGPLLQATDEAGIIVPV
jgi:hypothetical protein